MIEIQESRIAQIWKTRARNELTIVIPSYGCERYLPAAVESALHGPAAQVLIADDASGTASLNAALALERRYAGRVRVLRAAATRGTAANLNEAVKHVETPFFAKLDGDDVLIPGYLDAVFPIIAMRPDLAILSGHELRIAANEVLEFKPELLPSVRTAAEPKIMAGPDAYRFILNWNPNPCSCGTIYRTEAFRKIGGYDREMKWGEDWEIWLRFARDWEVGYSNMNSALYRIHQQSATAAGIRLNRLCYGYDAIFRRASEICQDPEIVPLIRRAFFLVAKGYIGAALRETRRSIKDSITCFRQALRALSTAVAL